MHIGVYLVFFSFTQSFPMLHAGPYFHETNGEEMMLDTGMSRYETSEEDYLSQFDEPEDVDPGDPDDEDEDD